MPGRAAQLSLVGLLALTGCASTVRVEPVATTESCTALIAALPARLEGQDRRSVEPQMSNAAAWGDPPIVVRCGVQTPATLRADSQLFTINGTDWFVEELTAGARFTTVGRSANVEVTVPDAYAPEANIPTELSGLVSARIPPA